MLKITFIVPAYNEELKLAKALNSIFTEITANPECEAEVIVVNNASTDKTAEVAKSFTNVKVINEPKKGLVFARSAGARNASGELLAHIDADCELPNGWLKTVLEEFSKNKKLVALSGPQFYFDLSPFYKFLVKIFYFLAYFFYFINKNVLKLGSILQGGNFVVKAWAWKKMGESSEEFNFYGEDTEACRKLFKLGEVKFTFKLPIITSGRRIIDEGILTIGYRYALNYFSVIFFKKPATKNYKDIRRH